MKRRSAGPPRPTSPTGRRAPWWHGAVAGLVGGALLVVTVSALSGVGLPRLLALIAAATDDAYAFREPAADVVVVGTAVHLAVSALWGLLFAGLVKPLPDVGQALLRGALYGIVVMAAMTFGLVPAFDPALWERVARNFPAWAAGHVVFGLALALLLHLDLGSSGTIVVSRRRAAAH